MRKKLISLIREVTPYWAEVLADYLFKNGVTIPVQCKDCKFGDMCSVREAMACSDRNAYCYRGERKDND